MLYGRVCNSVLVLWLWGKGNNKSVSQLRVEQRYVQQLNCCLNNSVIYY